MEARTNSTGYKLIEGQEKQGLLDRYINQLSDFDAESGVEIYQISANLLKSGEIIASQRDNTLQDNNVISRFTEADFHSQEPAYTNNQNNISSLSNLISKRKDAKSAQVSYEARGSRDWSANNITETIRSTLL